MEGVSEIMITYLPSEKKDAESAKTKIEKFGAKCHIYEVDLTEDGSSKKLADEAVKTMSNVNILFNNHAFQEVIQDPIKDLDEDHWRKTFSTNIHPFWFVSKYLAPQMKRGDTIINNASINA